MKKEPPSAYELGKDLFGKYASKQDSLSVYRKELVKIIISKKNAHNQKTSVKK